MIDALFIGGPEDGIWHTFSSAPGTYEVTKKRLLDSTDYRKVFFRGSAAAVKEDIYTYRLVVLLDTDGSEVFLYVCSDLLSEYPVIKTLMTHYGPANRTVD